MKLQKILIWVFLLIWAGVVVASEPSFNVPYNITAVDNNGGGSFHLQGTIIDTSQLGYGAPDVLDDDYVIIQSSIYGDIDFYQITNIVSQTGTLLICDVSYAETGTPRSGQPETGNQMISRDGYLYSQTFGMSEYLNNGARNLFYDMHGDRLVDLEGATNALDLAVTALESGSGGTNYVLKTAAVITGTTVFQPGNIQVITNGGSIEAAGTYVKIHSDSGEVGALAFPQITTGTNGQVLIVQGTNSSNVVTVTNGTDLVLAEEISFTFGSNAIMQLVYNGSAWVEIHRCANE